MAREQGTLLLEEETTGELLPEAEIYELVGDFDGQPRESNDPAGAAETGRPEPAAAAPAPAKPAAHGAHGSLASRLLAAEERIRTALAQMPAGLTDAREHIAAQFWTRPRPEDLQTLIRVASHPAFKGDHAEVPLKAISLRYLAETESEGFWDPALRQASEIRAAAEFLSQLAEVMAIFEARVEPEVNAIAAASADDRDQILRAARVLFPRQETIAGPRTIALKLAALLEAASREQVASLFPGISEDEAALFATDSPARLAGAPAWSRTALDAAALRAVLEEDLAGWETLTRFPEGTAPEAVSAEVLRNLLNDQLAYRAVSDRLQQVQDQAVRDGDRELSDRIVRLRGPLFATFRRLSPILMAHPEARLAAMAGVPTAPPEPGGQDLLGGEAAAAAAESAGAGEEALARARQAATARKASSLRKRSMLLGALAACGVAVALVVRMMLPPPPPDPIRVSPADFAGLAPLTSTQPVGTLLIARVSDAWAGLPETDRTAAVLSVSKVATQHGFRTLSLVSPEGDTVAIWDVVHGAQLLSNSTVLPASSRRPKKPSAR